MPRSARLHGLTVANMRAAHELLETRHTVDKVVIETQTSAAPLAHT